MPAWRVGLKVPLNVYEGERPVCQCHTPEDAARIVEAMNMRTVPVCTHPLCECVYRCNFLLFLLFVIVGWKVFGSPVQ